MPWEEGGRKIEKRLESTMRFYPDVSSLSRQQECSHNHVYIYKKKSLPSFFLHLSGEIILLTEQIERCFCHLRKDL